MRTLKILLAGMALFAGNVSAQSGAFRVGDGGAEGPGGDGGASSTGVAILQVEIKSKAEHAFEMVFSNGVQFVIDDASNKIIIANSSAIQEFDLDAALLQWANNDQTLATGLRQKLRTTLNDPMREMSLISDNFQFSSSVLGSDTTCFSVDGDCNSGTSGIETFSTSVSDYGASGWGNYNFSFQWLLFNEEDDEDDRRDWKRWRDDKCEDAAKTARTIALMVPPAVAACGTVAWCVLGALAIANEVDDWASANAACEAPYPGPGGW